MKLPEKYLNPRPRNSRLIYLLAGGLLLGAFQMISLIRDLHGSISADERRLHRLAAAENAVRPLTPSRGELDVQRRWAALRVEAAFSWYPLFHAIETASGLDVELLEFQPEKATRKLTLRGRAKDMSTVVNYVHRLSKQSAINDAYLAHQKSMTINGVNIVAFEIRATVL